MKQTIDVTRGVWDGEKMVPHEFTVTVDLDKLDYRLFRKAKGNKSKKSQVAAGAIVITSK